MIRWFSLPTVAAVILSAGCTAKLNYSKSVTLPGETSILDAIVLDPQPRAQTFKVKVDVTNGSPVDVFVIRTSDFSDRIIGSDADKKKWESTGLGFKRDLKSDSLTVSIPANTESTVIIIQSANARDRTTATITITN